MANRRTRSPKSEPLFRRSAERRPWRGYVRSLLSLLLLLAFLHSLLLPVPPARGATPAGTQSVLCAADALDDCPAGPCGEPLENAPDEEGDSGETAEPDKDFLADQITLPYFNLLLLKQLGYGELKAGRFCSPLPGFSPPPERVA
jgi:hypothetical protein